LPEGQNRGQVEGWQGIRFEKSTRDGAHKREEGKVIREDLVVQAERVVPTAPVVADALVSFDQQAGHAHRLEVRGDEESGLASSEYEHGRVLRNLFELGSALLAPGAVLLEYAARPWEDGKVVELLQHGEQSPSFVLPVDADEVGDPAALGDGRVEFCAMEIERGPGW
jgi:hypothetical protein